MQCLKPIKVRCTEEQFNAFGRTFMEVPCGKCEACIDNKRKNWYIRLVYEQAFSINSYFVTLTYDDVNLPLNSLGYPTFNKRDVQLFLKRLRRYCSKFSDIPVRFFLVSEYGSHYMRPHYHLLIFNVPDKIDVYNVIKEKWGKGFISASKATCSRIGYCANYMYGKSDMPPQYLCDDSNKLFVLCSRRPGIGYDYINDDVFDYHRKTLNNFMLDSKGIKYAMPRYLSDKIFTKEEKLELFKRNRDRLKEIELEEISEHIDYIQEHGPDAAHYTPKIQRQLEFKRKFYNKLKSHRKKQLNKKIK